VASSCNLFTVYIVSKRKRTAVNLFLLLHYNTPHEETDDLSWLIQSTPFWGSHSADVVESKLLRHRQRQRGLFITIIIIIRLATTSILFTLL